MNELMVFENEEFGMVRTVMVNGEPWLVGNDVAKALGYKNKKDAIRRHVDDQDKQLFQGACFTTFENNIPKEVLPFNFIDAKMPNRGATIINESGVYSLIMGSKMPKAKEFKHWVTSEVLPTIRKNNYYVVPQKQDEVANNIAELVISKINQKPKLIDSSKVAKSKRTELNKRVGIVADYLTTDFFGVWRNLYRAIEKKLDIRVNDCLYEYRSQMGNSDAKTFDMILHEDELYNATIEILDRFIEGLDCYSIDEFHDDKNPFLSCLDSDYMLNTSPSPTVKEGV